jgi:hypothetical protein
LYFFISRSLRRCYSEQPIRSARVADRSPENFHATYSSAVNFAAPRLKSKLGCPDIFHKRLTFTRQLEPTPSFIQAADSDVEGRDG